MNYGAMLAACREQFGYRPGLLSWFGSRKRGLVAPDWATDCAGDSIPMASMVAGYRTLLDRGIVVWGCIVQANKGAWRPGSKDLPCNLVFSPDPAFDDRPDLLMQVAQLIASVKDQAPQDPALAQMAALVTDEMNNALNHPVPRPLTGGRDVYFTTTWLHRRRLPGGILVNGLLPVVIHMHDTSYNMVLPRRFWPSQLASDWERAAADLCRRLGREPNQLDPAAEISPEAFADNPVRLTARAASAVSEMLAAEGMRTLRVGVESKPGFETETLQMIDDDPLWYAYRTEVDGIPIVVPDARSATLLAGVTIDYQTTVQGSGFTFDRA